MPKLVSIDLDGVLNTYEGKYDENEIPPIRDGAEAFLAYLSEKYIIEIFTARKKDLTYQWLKENNLLKYITDVTCKKNPKTSIFIDDRAITFDGNYGEVIEILDSFAPYWQKTE